MNIPVRRDVPNKGNKTKGTPVLGIEVGVLEPEYE